MYILGILKNIDINVKIFYKISYRYCIEIEILISRQQ